MMCTASSFLRDEGLPTLETALAELLAITARRTVSCETYQREVRRIQGSPNCHVAIKKEYREEPPSQLLMKHGTHDWSTAQSVSSDPDRAPVAKLAFMSLCLPNVLQSFSRIERLEASSLESAN